MEIRKAVTPEDIARAISIDEALLGALDRVDYIRSVAEKGGLSLAVMRDSIPRVLPSWLIRVVIGGLAKVHAVIWPVKLAQMSKAVAREWRWFWALMLYRRGRKKLLIWSCADKNLWAWRCDLKRPMIFSRFRGGRCEPSIRLFNPFCARWSAPGARALIGLI